MPTGSPTTEAAASYDCAPLANNETIAVGELASPAFADYYIAKQRGYFNDENITIKGTPVKGGSEAVAFVGAGKLDVALGGLSANTFNAFAKGIKVKYVMALGGSRSANALQAMLVVPTKLKTNGEITSIKDLRGKKVGLPGGAAGPSGYLVSVMLEQGGLTLADIHGVTLDRPSIVQALKTGAIDAALVSTPYLSQVVQSGLAEFLGDPGPMYSQTAAGYIFGDKLSEKDQAVGCAFMRALMKARQSLQSADYLKDPTVLKDLVASGFPQKSLETAQPSLFPESGHFQPRDIPTKMFKAYQAGGFIEDPSLKFSDDDFIDNKAMDAAFKSYEAEK